MTREEQQIERVIKQARVVIRAYVEGASTWEAIVDLDTEVWRLDEIRRENGTEIR